jgi:chromosome segregation ATPase
MSRHRFPLGLASAAVWFAMLFAAQAAFAQATRQSSGGNAQALQQVQALAAERTKLQADNARLQSELDKLRKERDELARKQGGAETRLKSSDAAAARAGARSDALKAELEREKGRVLELATRYRELAVQLREVETDRSTVKTALAQRELEMTECVARNRSLYSLNGEILTRLEKGGSFSAGTALEPFTKLKRIELENLIDGYQQRADEQRPPTAAR